METNHVNDQGKKSGTDQATSVTAPRATSTLPLWLGVPFLAIGPELTARFLLSHATSAALATSGTLPIALFVMVLLVWNPFTFSIPAAVLQFARRDAVLELRGVYAPRAVARRLFVAPYLLCSTHSKVRAEVLASFVGWTYAFFLVLPHLHSFTSLGF